MNQTLLRNLGWGLLLGILIAGTWLLTQQKMPAQALPDKKQHIADAIVEQMQIHTFDLSGLLERSMQAELSEHFWDDSSTELQQPEMTIYSATSQSWRIQSDTGWISPDQKIIKYLGDVLIENSAATTTPRGSDAIQIQTQNLIVRPQLDRLKTSEPVRIARNNDITTGIGMRASLKPELQLKLESDVRSHIIIERDPDE